MFHVMTIFQPNFFYVGCRKNYVMVMRDKLRRAWKEDIIASFKERVQHRPMRLEHEENGERPQDSC
jgi:hypothetical protein